MEQITITADQFQDALNWINGQESPMGEQEVKNLLDRMTAGFGKMFRLKHPSSPVPRFRTAVASPLSISAIIGEDCSELIERMKKDNERLIQEQERNRRLREEALAAEKAAAEALDLPVPEHKPQAATGVDSVLLYNAIGFVSHRAGCEITQSRAQIILYCIYGSSLVSSEGRLDIEHPQAWKYGPVFPRAYNKGNLADHERGRRDFEVLQREHGRLAQLLEWKTTSMLYTSMADLNSCHKGKGSPYGKTVAKNPDKWGVAIDDCLIAEQFSNGRKKASANAEKS